MNREDDFLLDTISKERTIIEAPEQYLAELGAQYQQFTDDSIVKRNSKKNRRN